MCNIGTTGLIVICFAVLAGAEVHRNAAQEELRKRAQMEASLEEAVKGEKILGSAAYYALLSPQFLETNSSTEERMNVLTLMLESLTHVRVPIGQEKITIALSGNFCMDLGREYRKLNGKKLDRLLLLPHSSSSVAAQSLNRGRFALTILTKSLAGRQPRLALTLRSTALATSPS